MRHVPVARQGLAAPYALVTGYAALLAVGTVAAALHGRFSATGVLVAMPRGPVLMPRRRATAVSGWRAHGPGRTAVP